jgi:hypothetical protein
VLAESARYLSSTFGPATPYQSLAGPPIAGPNGRATGRGIAHFPTSANLTRSGPSFVHAQVIRLGCHATALPPGPPHRASAPRTGYCHPRVPPHPRPTGYAAMALCQRTRATVRTMAPARCNAAASVVRGYLASTPAHRACVSPSHPIPGHPWSPPAVQGRAAVQAERGRTRAQAEQGCTIGTQGAETRRGVSADRAAQALRLTGLGLAAG